jgi:Luciferase
MGSRVKMLETEVTGWPRVTVGPHQFGAREFRFDKAEIGHVHFWGDVDIPFTRAVRDLLLADGHAQRHRWLPDSGWITHHIHNDADLQHAVWLMRLSYLRYALKSSSDAEGLLQEEAERLELEPQLKALMAQFLPRQCALQAAEQTAVQEIRQAQNLIKNLDSIACCLPKSSVFGASYSDAENPAQNRLSRR